MRLSSQLITATAVVMLAAAACTPTQPDDDSITRETSAPPSSPTGTPSPTPSPTTKPASPTNLINTREIDVVIPVPGCEFDVNGQSKAQETVYDGKDVQVILLADESSTVTNPANGKVFNATGDSVMVVEYAKDGSEGTVTSSGPNLQYEHFTLPGETKRRTGIIFMKGKATFQRHNIGTDDEWVEFKKISGGYTDVCKALAN